MPELVAEALTNDETAERRDRSLATANTHASRILLKLHARGRAQLVAITHENGLVKPRPHGTNNERAAPNRYEPSVRANVHQTLEVDDQASLIASLPQPAGNSTASTRAASLEDDAGARDPAPMVLASGDG